MKPGIDFIAVGTPFYCHDANGKFLLHKRSKNCRDEQGTWDCGSGILEFGLQPEENVLKEVKEEYGVQGIIQEQLPAASQIRILEGRKTHWVVIPFVIIVNADDVRINEPEKMDDIGWFRLNSLPQPLHQGFQIGLKRYKDYLEKYSR